MAQAAATLARRLLAPRKHALSLVYALPVRLFDFFKRKPETPAEHEALANLDEATRQVAWEEFDKEKQREQGGGSFGPLTPTVRHDPPGPVDDPDPPDERSLRDVLHGDDDPE